MIEESYVSFETARLLKEAGFDVPCYKQYSERGVQWDASYPENFNADDWGCSCPTQALAARWLREAHGLFIEIFYRITGFNYEITYTGTNDVAFTPHEPKINFISYEGCLEDGLQEAIKLIKN